MSERLLITTKNGNAVLDTRVDSELKIRVGGVEYKPVIKVDYERIVATPVEEPEPVVSYDEYPLKSRLHGKCKHLYKSHSEHPCNICTPQKLYWQPANPKVDTGLDADGKPLHERVRLGSKVRRKSKDNTYEVKVVNGLIKEVAIKEEITGCFLSFDDFDHDYELVEE